jgi:pimeloyl-ACP methyl ester carboxylesterase
MNYFYPEPDVATGDDLAPRTASPGDLRRPMVVLLHASGSSSRQWSALAERLSPAFDVHAVDLHGHGGQDPWRGPRPVSVHDEAALVLPAIERAGGAHLIGHSYGAAVAMHLAAARPSLVHSLAVYEPVVFNLLSEREPHGAATLEAMNVAASLRAMLAAGEAAAAAERFIDYWSGDGVFAGLGPKRQSPIAQRMCCIVPHFDALFAEPLPWRRLARLDVPMLCLTGSGSTAVCLRIDKLLRTLLPDAQHEMLAGLGHMGPITHPARVNGRLLRFLGIDEPAQDRAAMRLPVHRTALTSSLAVCA